MNQEYIAECYEKGRAHAAAGCVCHITGRGSWAVSYPSTVGFEPYYRTSTRVGSGYDLVGEAGDPYGAALLRGWLDGRALIVDHRGNLDGVIITP